MNRRTYLGIGGAAVLAGCLNWGGTPREPGEVTCAEGVEPDPSNVPGDGSWPTELHDMQNTSYTPLSGPSGCVETQWTFSPEAHGILPAGPVAADGQVYVPNKRINETWFTVVDAASGDVQWQYDGGPDQQLLPRQSPTLVDEKLYLANGDNLARVDLEDRTRDWLLDFTRETIKSPGVGTPRVIDDTVYVTLDTGFVLAFDAATGDQVWMHDIEGLPAGTTVEDDNDSIAEARRRGMPSGTIAATKDRVFVPSWDFTLTALDAATGERLWEFTLGADRLDRMEAPAIVDGHVYVQTANAILYVLDAATGEVIWTYDEYGYATDGISPIVDDETVYVVAGTSTENLYLVALDRADHSVRWERPVGPPFQDPVADENTIYIDQGRELRALDKATGEYEWTVQTEAGFPDPPAVVDGAVFVADQEQHYAVW